MKYLYLCKKCPRVFFFTEGKYISGAYNFPIPWMIGQYNIHLCEKKNRTFENFPNRTIEIIVKSWKNIYTNMNY